MTTRSGIFALPEETRTSMRRWMFVGMAVLMLAGIAFAFWPAVAASQRMQGFCEGLVAGTPIGEVQAQAATRGYQVSTLANGGALVKDPRLSGRRTCTLQFGEQRLQSSKVTEQP